MYTTASRRPCVVVPAPLGVERSVDGCRLLVKNDNEQLDGQRDGREDGVVVREAAAARRKEDAAILMRAPADDATKSKAIDQEPVSQEARPDSR